MGSPSDQDLVREASRGNRDAFAELVARYEKKVYTMAYRFLGNEADAMDLTQEVFLRLYRALATFRGEASFATWLHQITANACRDELRRRRGKGFFSWEELKEKGKRDGLGQEIEEMVLAREERLLVQRALNLLPPELRLILLIREYQGFSYEEISRLLDIPLGTVKSRLNRARQLFREVLLAQIKPTQHLDMGRENP